MIHCYGVEEEKKATQKKRNKVKCGQSFEKGFPVSFNKKKKKKKKLKQFCLKNI